MRDVGVLHPAPARALHETQAPSCRGQTERDVECGLDLVPS